MTWAADARKSGPMGTTERLVLIAMAEPADVDGRRSFLSATSISERVGISVRQVRRCIGTLEQLGVITRAADQGPAQYLRADRRPVVWDLLLHAQTRGSGVTPTTYRDSHPVGPRGDTQGRHGVTPVSPEPTTKHTPETTSVVEVTTTRARAISEADQLDAQGRFHCTRCDVWAFPGLHSCNASPRPANFADMVEQARLELDGEGQA